MNQHTVVVALIRKKNKILLLRYAGNQGDKSGKYELPGGELEYGEQPEQALLRHLKQSAGLEIGTPYLSDVFTYIDGSNGKTQYTVIAYEVVSLGDRDNITLHTTYNRYVWEEVDDVDIDSMTEQSRIIMSTYMDKISTVDIGSYQVQDDLGGSREGAVVYSDGGSRGNPGPSAAGYVVFDSEKRLIYEGGAYLGITTNNLAEYHGVYLGLEKARELGFKAVEFRLDSLLVVNQLNGVYVIRNRELWPIHERVRDMMKNFDKITFRHVKREFNQQADSMVNKILDAH